MNWEPSFIWQDSNDRTMSPDFSSTPQDTSWEPWIHKDKQTNKQTNKKRSILNCNHFSFPKKLSFQRETWTCLMETSKTSNVIIFYFLWINITCHSLCSHGVRGHWGHTHSCSVDPTHSELVASVRLQTCYLGNKQASNLVLVKGGELWVVLGGFFCAGVNHNFG